jgi:hypothetical protein
LKARERFARACFEAFLKAEKLDFEPISRKSQFVKKIEA